MNTSSQHQPPDLSRVKICFIMGIMQRSGTNYIFKLLTRHPRCLGSGPIWEDFFIHNSHLLEAYVHSLYSKWNPRWNVSRVLGPPEKLLQNLGQGIAEFIKDQISVQPEQKKMLECSDPRKNSFLVTKTPSISNLHNFCSLFPDHYLIIVVRDGRSVVESGEKSFGWNREKAARRWTRAAGQIRRVLDSEPARGKNILLLRYEDMVRDEPGQLQRVFNFLQINPEEYDFQGLADLKVYGSSEITSTGGSVHWNGLPRTRSFNPVQRYAGWQRSKHRRFNWIAGREMQALGYELAHHSSFPRTTVLINTLHDFLWHLLETGHRGLRAAAFARTRIRGSAQEKP